MAQAFRPVLPSMLASAYEAGQQSSEVQLQPQASPAADAMPSLMHAAFVSAPQILLRLWGTLGWQRPSACCACSGTPQACRAPPALATRSAQPAAAVVPAGSSTMPRSLEALGPDRASMRLRGPGAVQQGA